MYLRRCPFFRLRLHYARAKPSLASKSDGRLWMFRSEITPALLYQALPEPNCMQLPRHLNGHVNSSTWQAFVMAIYSLTGETNA